MTWSKEYRGRCMTASQALEAVHRLPARKTLRERAVALIPIADPRFQQEPEDFAVRSLRERK